METNQELSEAPLTKDQEQEVVNNALAIVSEADRNDILKVVKTNDVVLIETHKKKLKNFKRRYPASDFEITEGMVFNKEAYDKALAAWREMKNYRTQTVVKDFQKLKAPYIAITKYYNETCNPLIEQFKDVETPVGEYVDKMEALQKAEKDAEKIAQENRSSQRVQTLIDAGAVFDGSYYSVGSEEFAVELVSLGMDTINSVPDDIFEKLLKEITEKALFIAGKEKEKAEAAAKEQEKKDNELKQLKEQNIRVRTRELKTLGLVPDVAKDGITVTTKQIEELGFEEWNTLFDGLESSIEEEKNKVAKRNLIAARENELIALGLHKYATGWELNYKQICVSISYNALETLDAESWGVVLDKAVSDIAKQKEAKVLDDLKANEEKELATVREKELAPYWQFVTAEEKGTLGKMEAAVYVSLLANVKQLHSDKVAKDIKDKQVREDKEKADRLAAQGDKAMYDDFLARLKEVAIPAVTTDEFKSKVATITTFINGLK